MRRRDFILAGGATVAWPLAAYGQQLDRLRRIAVLGDSQSDSGWISAFVERLRELGWTEGGTIAIEYRWSELRPERVPEAAATFVLQKPDVIITYGGAATILKSFHRIVDDTAAITGRAASVAPSSFASWPLRN